MSADPQLAEKEEFMTEEPDNPEAAQSGQNRPLAGIPRQEISTDIQGTSTNNQDNPTTTPPQPLTDEQINEAVAHINELAIGTLYQGSTQIGEYVLTTFFNNNQQLAQSRHPFKDFSYRKLCEREDLLVSEANLNRMVRVAIQERFFQEQGLNVETLTFTHKAELVRIPNIPRKTEFVRELIENLPTTRQLSEKVNNLLSEINSNGQPDPSRKIINQLYSLEKWVSKNNFNGIEIDTEILQRMKGKGKSLLLERVQAVETQMVELNRIIGKIKETLNPPQTAGGQAA